MSLGSCVPQTPQGLPSGLGIRWRHPPGTPSHGGNPPGCGAGRAMVRGEGSSPPSSFEGGAPGPCTAPPTPFRGLGGGGPKALCVYVGSFPSPLHMTEQLFAFSFLKVEEMSSERLGRCRSLLERLRGGLRGGCEGALLRQMPDTVRKMLWTLFSEVKAEHSRYPSAPNCLAAAQPWEEPRSVGTAPKNHLRKQRDIPKSSPQTAGFTKLTPV